MKTTKVLSQMTGWYDDLTEEMLTESGAEYTTGNLDKLYTTIRDMLVNEQNDGSVLGMSFRRIWDAKHEMYRVVDGDGITVGCSFTD